MCAEEKPNSETNNEPEEHLEERLREELARLTMELQEKERAFTEAKRAFERVSAAHCYLSTYLRLTYGPQEKADKEKTPT